MQFPTIPLREISRDTNAKFSKCWSCCSTKGANEVGSVNKLYTTVIAQRDTRREYVEGLVVGPRAFVYVSRRSWMIPSIRDGEERVISSPSSRENRHSRIIIIIIIIYRNRCTNRSRSRNARDPAFSDPINYRKGY